MLLRRLSQQHTVQSFSEDFVTGDFVTDVTLLGFLATAPQRHLLDPNTNVGDLVHM